VLLSLFSPVDFVSKSLVIKLNALTNCYASPSALNVCCGLDGTCYKSDVLLTRARVGAKSEEPCSAVVMLEIDGLESVTRLKRTRVLYLE
jgi:hypothetical protein